MPPFGWTRDIAVVSLGSLTGPETPGVTFSHWSVAPDHHPRAKPLPVESAPNARTESVGPRHRLRIRPVLTSASDDHAYPLPAVGGIGDHHRPVSVATKIIPRAAKTRMSLTTG